MTTLQKKGGLNEKHRKKKKKSTQKHKRTHDRQRKSSPFSSLLDTCRLAPDRVTVVVSWMLPGVGLDKFSNRQNLRVKRDGAAAYQLSSLTNAHLFHGISWPFFFFASAVQNTNQKFRCERKRNCKHKTNVNLSIYSL
jgi:hypothetical protein